MRTNTWNRIITCFYLIPLMILTCAGCGPSLAQIREWEKTKAVLPLIEALNEEDELIQTQAAQALARIGKPAAEPMIAALKNNGNAHFQEGLIKALSKTRRSWVEDPLIITLNDKKEKASVLMAVARILRNQGSSRAVQAVIDRLEHANPEVRKKMAWTLGKIGDSRAVRPLETLVQNDPDINVRQMAIEALSKVKER